jgi:hypothetical protein
MATARQIAAARRNALLSTGPRTEPGKLASRRNALKHGYAGLGWALPDDFIAQFRQDFPVWESVLRNMNYTDTKLTETFTLEWLRFERLCAEERELLEQAAEEAALLGDQRRNLAAEQLISQIAQAPAVIARQLRLSRHGCAALVMRLRALLALLENDAGAWTAEQLQLAFDCLGVPPELRAMPNPLGRGATLADLEPAVATATLREQIAVLEAEQTRLEEFELRQDAAAGLGLGLEISHRLQLVRRYMTTSFNRVAKILDLICGRKTVPYHPRGGGGSGSDRDHDPDPPPPPPLGPGPGPSSGPERPRKDDDPMKGFMAAIDRHLGLQRPEPEPEPEPDSGAAPAEAASPQCAVPSAQSEARRQEPAAPSPQGATAPRCPAPAALRPETPAELGAAGGPAAEELRVLDLAAARAWRLAWRRAWRRRRRPRPPRKRPRQTG